MVDAATLFARDAMDARRGRTAGSQSVVEARVSSDASAYLDFCRGAMFAPAQGPDWVSAWTAETGPDAVFAILCAEGQPVLMLALEVEHAHGCAIARFMGGRHANGNFPAYLPDGVLPDASNLAVLTQAIRSARPDIDLIALERLEPEFCGVANPLLALPSFVSPNIALAVDLTGGFDAVLARTSGKRKRKKYRTQLRKFEAVGDVRRIEARTPQETERLLDAFFAMKAVRFQKAGIRDVFAAPDVRAFFRRLFAEALGPTQPAFVLHGLEVAGKLRSVTGATRSAGRMTSEFGAIAEDDVAPISPGDFLYFENIKEACDQGLVIYDFGVGDEPYKRLWCDIETEHRDVLVPLTFKGRLLASGLRAFTGAKARIKNNPTVWRLAKRLRRSSGSQPLAEERSDD